MKKPENLLQKPVAVDYPYYDGSPTPLSGQQWCLVISSVVLAAVILLFSPRWMSSGVWQFIPAMLFASIPLMALAFTIRHHWKALFRPVKVRDIGLMFGVAALNLLVTVAIGLVVTKLYGANSNPALASLNDMSSYDIVLFFAKTIPQLIGEEIFTMLPFLALLTYCYQNLGLSKIKAVSIAWIGSAIIFALLHLPTYQYNFVQCLLIIGSARLILTFAYIKTKNLWVSAGAHIINDWAMFFLVLLSNTLQKT